MGPLVRLIGQGIGLAREGLAARKAPQTSCTEVSNGEDVRDPLSPPAYEKRSAADEEPGGSPYGDPKRDKDRHHDQEDFAPHATITDFDEEYWYLDETASEVAGDDPPPYGHTPTGEVDELVLKYEGEPQGAVVLGRLERPVILPQRRPRDKTRGFVRAYAPMLRDCGIDQATFLNFIEDFYQSSKANPIFNVINLAAFGAGLAPSVTAMVVSIVVQTASQTAKQIQERHRTNTFLDQMNAKFFGPRGLFCLLMTYKPYQAKKTVSVDTSTTIAKTLMPADSEFKDKLKTLRNSSGVTGEIELPEAAPLVFPALDKAAENAETKSTMRQASSFMAEYLDRRAQAAYAHQNPGSKLSLPPESQRQFASRYSDPNHPASNGSLISLLTGGHVNPRAGVDKLRQKYRDHQREKVNAEAAEHGEAREVVPQTKVANREGLLKRVMRQDVLYLTIVNMPSEEELAAAREALELQKTTSQGSTFSEARVDVVSP